MTDDEKTPPPPRRDKAASAGPADSGAGPVTGPPRRTSRVAHQRGRHVRAGT
jgi:hypothetical protein